MAQRKTVLNLMKPYEIKEYLDMYVIGQDEAKKTLSVAVYNHYKRLLHKPGKNGVEIDKSNVILLGETGCGKTLMVRTIAKMLGVPCYIQDCTKITASGYVGSDVEDCLVGLLRVCDYDINKAEMGIVVLDEGDKISKKDAGPSITRDVSGECVQQSLLKIVEGDIVGVPPMGGRKHPEQKLLYVNTKNILFILSGAFVGLNEIIRKRKRSLGSNTRETKAMKDEYYLSYTSPEDIREFGLIPEFVGRFPIITNVNPLTKEDLVKIISEPKNSLIKQYKQLLAMDGVTLKFEKKALETIANVAFTLKTGARGLRSVMETVMKDIMYDAPRSLEKSITITEKMVQDATEVKFE